MSACPHLKVTAALLLLISGQSVSLLVSAAALPSVCRFDKRNTVCLYRGRPWSADEEADGAGGGAGDNL